MEHRFDTLARSLVAEPIPRRSALRRIAGGLAALFVAPAALPALVGAATCLVDSDCFAANATGACNSNGECVIVACDAGYADCDGVFDTGCEVNTGSDPANCGACGHVCTAPANASATCMGGACGFNCNNGYVQQGNQCVASGGQGAVPCTGGCAAANATTDCDRRTVMCVIVACNAGFADCDGNYANGCEVNTKTDLKNCGACGHVCPAVANGTATCTGGACGFVCNAGFSKCNGACVNLKADAKNCGTCGNVCTTAVANATAVCTNGTCGFVCNTGFTPCGGKCVPTASFQTDKNNCGTCGNVCTTAVANATAVCTNGACGFTCNNGFTKCNGACKALTTDVANCGACGNVCPAVVNGTTVCAAGKCGVGTCNAGYTKSGNACVPNVCLTGNDPETGSPYVVCRANATTAWLSSTTFATNRFHADQICKQLGYGKLGRFGGNCGSVCGYCPRDSGTTCSHPGSETYDGSGSRGSDTHGPILGEVVNWECVPLAAVAPAAQTAPNPKGPDTSALPGQ